MLPVRCGGVEEEDGFARCLEQRGGLLVEGDDVDADKFSSAAATAVGRRFVHFIDPRRLLAGMMNGVESIDQVFAARWA